MVNKRFYLKTHIEDTVSCVHPKSIQDKSTFVITYLNVRRVLLNILCLLFINSKRKPVVQRKEYMLTFKIFLRL